MPSRVAPFRTRLAPARVGARRWPLRSPAATLPPGARVTGATSLVGRVVAASCRRPWTVLLLSLLLAAAALGYTARNFAMTTDTAELLSPDLAWRRHEAAFDAAFPQQAGLIVAVLDAATPELAEDAAARLAERLRARPGSFRTVRRPESGPFFEENGLLLLPLDEVVARVDELVSAQPFLGPLAADPSLRGVSTVLSAALAGVRRGEARLEDMRGAASALADAFEAAAAGRPAFFSWRALIAGEPGTPQERRRFVLIQPVLDYGALQPGARASEAIRAAARELDLDPAHGVTLRLTGSVRLADEEFATLTEDAEVVTGAMLLALVAILWLAVRSIRFVAAILLAAALGLVVTTGLGLLAVGRFNLISVAFIPLFVGLGVDFAIQVCVRCRAERPSHRTLREALVAAGNGIGNALALAAAAIAAGFFAFLPTSYVGVAELGAVAGVGMIVAFILSVTLLPALVVLLRPPAETATEIGYAWLAPVEAWLHRHRRAVLGAAVAAAAVSVALLPLVRFDFNPLHLRSPKVESMAALAVLLADPDRTPNTIQVLAPSLAEADALARRLETLPEMARAVTLSSFLPSRQEEKLEVVRDAAMLLGPTLDPVETRPPPSDSEVVQDLAATAAGLRRAAAPAPKEDPAAEAARRLADVLDRLSQASPEARAAASDAVVTPLRILLRQVRALLKAGPVTLESLPRDFSEDWIAPGGQARVQVFPRGDAAENHVLRRFSEAVQAVAPGATGTPVLIRETGDTIVAAFLQAAALSGLALVVLLAAALRRARDVALTMLPVLLSGALTLASCVVLDLPLNYANIIALPLLLGIGVAFNIYFVEAWRRGSTGLLRSSLTRAVVFSALTTATAFGALWLSSHPGTASMGKLLMLSLVWELAVTLLFRPALLGRPPQPPRHPGRTSGPLDAEGSGDDGGLPTVPDQDDRPLGRPFVPSRNLSGLAVDHEHEADQHQADRPEPARWARHQLGPAQLHPAGASGQDGQHADRQVREFDQQPRPRVGEAVRMHQQQQAAGQHRQREHEARMAAEAAQPNAPFGHREGDHQQPRKLVLHRARVRAGFPAGRCRPAAKPRGRSGPG